MYIYESGLIGRAVREKIENTKASVRGQVGSRESSDSFGDILKSMMSVSDEVKKPVGYTGTTPEKNTSISGESLLCAVRNADEDTTASAVLSALGFSSAESSSSLKTAADNLKANAEKLLVVENADEATVKTALSAYTGSLNEVTSLLSTASGTSAYMYSTGLKAAVDMIEEALSKAGITVGNDRRLSFNPVDFVSLDGAALNQGVTSLASTISTYSEAIMGESGDSLLSFLTGEDEDETANYYSSLLTNYL